MWSLGSQNQKCIIYELYNCTSLLIKSVLPDKSIRMPLVLYPFKYKLQCLLYQRKKQITSDGSFAATVIKSQDKSF